MELDTKIDPIELFQKWFEEAKKKKLETLMLCKLATVSKNGFHL